MKNHVTAKKMILLAAAAALFTACSPMESGDAANSHSTVSVPASSTAEEVQNTQTRYRLVSSADGIFYEGRAQVEDGFYDLVYTKDVLSGAQNIVYTDFPSRHRVYLSSDVGSDHQSEDDTSYIPTAVGGATVFADDEYVYVLKKGSLLLQKASEQDAKSCIYRLNPNGSGRIALELSFDRVINSASGVFADGDALVLLVDSVDKDTSLHPELVRADFSSRRITTLMDLSEAGLDLQNASLVNSFGDKLVLSSSKIEENGTLVRELYTLDPAKEAIVPLASFDTAEQYVFYRDDAIYYIESSENALYQFDPSSGESTLLLDEIAPPELEFDSVQAGFPAPEPYLEFFFTKGESSVTYYWNSATGQWHQKLLMDGDRPVTIYRIWQDYFLVKLQDKMVTYQDFTQNGQAYENQMAVAEYALIRQEDYWNGVPDYIRFTDDVYGNQG